jgi:thymidine kinase
MKRKGKLEVICGSMFSGKSEELMYRLRRAEYAKQNVLTIKHQIDNRHSLSCIVSHDGTQREAFPISNDDSAISKLKSLVTDKTEVVGIDEIQFFPQTILSLIDLWVEKGVRVIVAGLDLDFRKVPFGIVPTLMAQADVVVKLRAICMSCGDEANYTQRLINGQPACYDDPIILVGGKECYEPRCRHCHKIGIRPSEVESRCPSPTCATHK